MRLHEDARPQAIRTGDIYPVLPTIANTVEEIAATAKRLLDQFNNLPMDETLNDIRDAARQVKAMTGLLAEEGVAYDIGAYRDAPAGLRIWCGATVEEADVRALMPWLEWAYTKVSGA